MTKSEYNRRWYQANCSYKKTYSRLNGSRKRLLSQDRYEAAANYGITLGVLVEDRQKQVKSGRWIDERGPFPYEGIS